MIRKRVVGGFFIYFSFSFFVFLFNFSPMLERGSLHAAEMKRCLKLGWREKFERNAVIIVK